MTESDPISVANRWIEAYNAKDYETLDSLMGDELDMVHHNRGVELNGPVAALGIMRQFDDLLSTKRFHSTRRQFADGMVTEQTWEATATTDIPGFVGEGETINLELCCVGTVRDGKDVEYEDYG
jgi:hypothetical protein